jgi:DNA-binding response OmpR family regulator
MRKKLECEGMEVFTARSGAECLEIVPREQPDLILLDVMMPLMDGMEVCEQLKANEETQTIPIIFLTAHDSKEGMLQGLAAGAADYITKPVDLDETVARVRAQLHYHELFKQNIELTHRLSEARRAAALGALSQGISHNLNNLLGVVFGYLELAKGSVNKPEVAAKHLDKVESAVVRMTRIIRQVTTVSTQMQLSLTRVEVTKLVDGAIERFVDNQDVKFPTTVVNHVETAVVLANVEVFEDAIGKLLENAWESYGSRPPEGAEVIFEIGTAQREGRDWVEFSVHDRDNGLDPDIRDHVFEPFVSTKNTVGVGMGLTIARHGIRNLGGDIALKDRPGGGTSATFCMPIADSVAASAA